MPTYPVTLTKVSNNTVSHSLHLAEGQEGQPRVQLGSREKEAAKAGQRGTIVIQSLHCGSGQHIARDPMMYEFADGMFADEPGILRTHGALVEWSTIGTGLPFNYRSRGGLGKTRLLSNPKEAIVIVPSAVYSVNVAGTPSLGMNALANSSFTGSFAKFGRYTSYGYFGQVGNTVEGATWAGRISMAADNFSNNAGFNASFVVSRGDKMWASTGVLRDIAVAWTDDAINSTPIFSSPYSLLAGITYQRDLVVIGPHALLIFNDESSVRGVIAAVDADGLISPVLSDLPLISSAFSYLGGAIVLFQGGTKALWLNDVSSYRFIDLTAVGQPRGSLGLMPPMVPYGSVLRGAMGASLDPRMFYSLYGRFTGRAGSTVLGSVICEGMLRPDGGFSAHSLVSPDRCAFLENASVMALQASAYWGTGADGGSPVRATGTFLQALVAQENAGNASQSDVKLYTLELPTDGAEASAYDTTTKFLRTSRYVGDDWVTKQGELLRGYVTKLPANSTAIVRLYLDGDSNETYNFSINTAGPFAQSLPANVIGRDVALDMETNANGAVIIEFPWSLDYFAVPDQKDIVRLPVLAGRDQVLPGGGLTTKTRAETLVALESICTSKERWTLEWWDETPDWDVIPLGYEAAEIEPAHVEGAGAAVAWLTLQRL